MSPEKLRAISSLGGKSIPAHLRSFAQNRDLASTAGAKGGAASHGGGRAPGSKNTHE